MSWAGETLLIVTLLGVTGGVWIAAGMLSLIHDELKKIAKAAMGVKS